MNIKTAIRIATLAHGRTLDKGGFLYLLHPVAVMNSVEGEDAKVVAILHDVIEDTYIELDDLIELTEVQREALDAITRREGEPYMEYINSLKFNKLAVYIKLADLKHNMGDDRMAGCNASLMDRYIKTVNILEEII